MRNSDLTRASRGPGSHGLLEIDDAALYQSLHRLEDRGCVRSEWGLSDNNRRAKYYTLTPRGRKALTRENESWRTYVQAVVTVMAPERAE
jgi:PadR family transcriptional regulator, regulatory protein PadR